MLVHYWLVWLLTILSNTKTKKQKTKKQKWSNILNQILHGPWWHEFCPGVIICDWHFFLVFFVLFCFWKWMRKLRIFYFAYSQSHSSRSDHGGQEFWYFLRVECILLKLQNLASLGAEFVPRSLLQRFFFVPRPLLKSVLSSERYTSIHRLNLDYTSQWCEPGFVYGRTRTREN